MPDPEWIKIPFVAGSYPDEAPSEAEAHWRDVSWVRWVVSDAGETPALQVMGGWEKASTDTFLGKIRNILQYTTNLTYPVAALGGHTSTWALYDGELYFTTPIVTYGTLTNPFTTSLGDATVTVHHVAHGHVTGDFVNFPESPVVTGSGITLPSGYYAVTRVDADNYTVEGPNVATAAVVGVGGTVDYEAFLGLGNEYSLGGAGYGTGTYGSGTYGRSSSNPFAARTWKMATLGQNVIGAPRDGGVYELAPYFTSTVLTEMVTNGTFTGSATGWTLGANWAYGANAITATLSNAAASQSITVTAGTWNILKLTVSAFAAGTMQVSVNGSSVGSAISADGRYFLRFWGGVGGAQTLAFTGTGFTGTVDNVSAKILGTFAPLANAPTRVTGVLVTPQGHVEVWGAVPTGESEFDPMCIKSSDADDPQDWSISTSNEAREEFLFGGSRIITGLVAGDQVHYITDTALFERTYQGSPSLVWSTRQKGNDCGCIGINAATYGAGRTWWMGNNRTFWVYDGSAPQPLTCPGTKWVFDNIQFIQLDLIQCWHNAMFKEIWWCWPDRRDNTSEVSRYAAYNYITGKWTFGSRVRTAWGEARGYRHPLAAGTDGYLYYHEKGDSADGSPLDFSARSGAFDIGDGNTLAEISGYMPDTQDQAGSYSIRFYGYEMNRNSTPEDTGMLAVTPSATNLMNFFVQGRQIEMELTGNDSPMRLRVGNPRFLVQDTGNQF